MAEQLSTPRITAPYLDNFVGRVVMLVGKVTQLRGDQATLDADGTVTVLLNREAHLVNGNGVQVIGKVNPDLSIKVLTSRDLGTDVDHGSSQSSQPAYIPRVAMVWSSPENTRSSNAEPPASCSCHNPSSATTSHRQDHSRAIPQRETARRSQDRLRSGQVPSRPTTATSFTTTSSDMIFDRQPPSDEELYRSRSPSPVRHMLPSPPQVSQDFTSRPSSPQQYSSETESSYTIPSAQQYAPLVPFSPQTFSTDSAAASLPSPPPSQERKNFSHGGPSTPRFPDSQGKSAPLAQGPRNYPFEDFAPLTPKHTREDYFYEASAPLAGEDQSPGNYPLKGSVPSTPRRPNPRIYPYEEPAPSGRRLQSPRQHPSQDSSSPTLWPNPNPHTGRQRDLDQKFSPVPPTPQPDDDSELMESVLDGIGRMHVAMGKDDAGRWRIRRAEGERP